MAQRPDPNASIFSSLFKTGQPTNANNINTNQLAQMLQYGTSASNPAAPSNALNNQQQQQAILAQQQQAHINAALSQMMQAGNLPSSVLSNLPFSSQMQLLQSFQQQQQSQTNGGLNIVSPIEWRSTLTGGERQNVINNLYVPEFVSL